MGLPKSNPTGLMVSPTYPRSITQTSHKRLTRHPTPRFIAMNQPFMSASSSSNCIGSCSTGRTFSGSRTRKLPNFRQRLRRLQPDPGGQVRGGGLHVHFNEVPACDVEQLVEVLVRAEIPDDVKAFYDAGVHPFVGHGKDARQFELVVFAKKCCGLVRKSYCV